MNAVTNVSNVNNTATEQEVELRQRIDSLIFGYFQRMGYSKCIDALTLESTFLAVENRKNSIGGKTVISINDRVHDKILEDIITLYIQDGRFDVSRELLEVGESLRQVVNRFTTLTTLPNSSRSDMHQKLYGRPLISRHSQPIGYISKSFMSPHKNTNFNSYVLQQPAVARAQLCQQMIIQQGELRYQQQAQRQQTEIQRLPNEMNPYQIEQRQNEHSRERHIQLQQRIDSNKTDENIFYPMEDTSSNVAKQSQSNSSEGSARRKLHAPQSLNSKVQESLIDPLVGIINERPWDSVSDINIEELHGIDNLDVIGKDFLAAFDYLPEREETSNGNPLENYDGSRCLNSSDQINVDGMRLDSEIVIDSAPQKEFEANIIEHEKVKPKLNQGLQILHDRMDISVPATIPMPEPLISPIESTISSKDGFPGKIRKQNSKEERQSTSSDLSSMDDDRVKNKLESSSKSSKKDDKRNEIRNSDKESKRRNGNDERREHRRSNSPSSERKRIDNRSKLSEDGSSSKDIARLNLKRSRDRSSEKRNKRIRDDNKTEKRCDMQVEKSKKSRLNELSREGSKHNKSVPESDKKGDIKKHNERKLLKSENFKEKEREPLPVKETPAKMKNSLMNKLRLQKKNESLNYSQIDKRANNSGSLLDNIGKEMNAFSNKTADEISIQHKKKVDYRIPKKSSISNESTPASVIITNHFSYSPSSSKMNATIESPKECDISKESETSDSTTDKKSDDEEPLCEGEEREDTTAFISPKLSVLRLAAMLVNADKKYAKAQNEDRGRSSYSQSGDDSNIYDTENDIPPVKVNTNPKSAKYAPQKVNSYCTMENKDDSSDSENDKEASTEDGELESPKGDGSGNPYRKSINLSKASEMLDLLHANSD